MERSNDNFCVILAGGRGKRLWPSSRQEKPKQFLDFFGTGRTQLQQTYDRFVNLLPSENIFICTNQDFAPMVREQLPEVQEEHILIEPVNRNTAPSVAWACYRIRRICPQANVVVSPSDQAVMSTSAFEHDLKEAFRFISTHDNLLVLGVKPTRPEPGYGYIQVDEREEGSFFKVKSFTEKPDREFARLFMESGEFYWNTGIFLSNVKTMVEWFKKLLPPVLRVIDSDDSLSIDKELAYVRESFPSYPNLVLDYAILEQCDNVYIQTCDFGWADMGTWHSIYEALSTSDEDNVVLDSEVMMEGCKGNVIKLPKGRLGVLQGLEGFIVAENENVLLVCKKGDSSALVRKYVNEVGIKYGEDFV